MRFGSVEPRRPLRGWWLRRLGLLCSRGATKRGATKNEDRNKKVEFHGASPLLKKRPNCIRRKLRGARGRQTGRIESEAGRPTCPWPRHPAEFRRGAERRVRVRRRLWYRRSLTVAPRVLWLCGSALRQFPTDAPPSPRESSPCRAVLRRIPTRRPATTRSNSRNN